MVSSFHVFERTSDAATTLLSSWIAYTSVSHVLALFHLLQYACCSSLALVDPRTLLFMLSNLSLLAVLHPHVTPQARYSCTLTRAGTRTVRRGCRVSPLEVILSSTHRCLFAYYTLFLLSLSTDAFPFLLLFLLHVLVHDVL